MSAKMHARWRALVGRIGSGYPPTIQILVTILLIALPLGVLSDAASVVASLPLWRPLTLIGLALIVLVCIHSVRITKLKMWQQLCLLGLQCGLISAMQLMVTSTVSGYLFIVPVIQAVYLFGVWVWLPVAGFVWLAWGSTAIIATNSWLDWIGANIYAIFLLLAVALAAAAYTYQHRARVQFEALMQQLQQQYAAAKASLEHVSHRATLEERKRLVNSVSEELHLALGHLDHMISGTIAQAQASVGQSQHLLHQTQSYARETIESVRTALTTLRPSSEPVAEDEQSAVASTSLDGVLLLSPRLRRLLDWLPLLFGALVPFWALIEHHNDGILRLEYLSVWLVLVICYLYTQWSRNTPWFQLGLVGQTCSLLAMVAITQSSALLIGLAMVAGQIALRCSWSQMIGGFIALQGAVGLVITVLNPAPWQIVTSLLLFAILVTALVVPIITARRRLNQRAQANQLVLQINAAMVRLNSETQALRQQAVIAERHRVAREIHDGLGHYLMSISMQLHLAQDVLATDPPAALRQLHETQRLIAQAQRHFLHSLDALNPLPDEPNALHNALDELVQHYNQQDTPRVTLSLDGSLDGLSPDVNLALFRVAQEGLTNAVRHGNASEVRLSVIRWPAQVQLVVADNGCAGSCDSAGTGLGLLGVRERAALLGGISDAAADPNGGFVLRFEVPLTQATTL